MAVAAPEVVETQPLLDRIINYVNDTGYKDMMESAARFNIRIRKDRTYRGPYIDSQTGIAHRHCDILITNKKRMPGILQGQIYTYPAHKWRSRPRSYLAQFVEPAKSDPDEHTITTVENPAAAIPVEEPPEKSAIKNTSNRKNDISTKEEPEPLNDEFFEEHYEDEETDDFETEEDNDDETYSNKGRGYKRKGRGGKKNKRTLTQIKKKPPPPPTPKNTPNKVVRGGRKTRIMEDEEDTTGKPFPCDLCDSRYKTRPGLIYHYTHHHKEGENKPNEESEEPPSSPNKSNPPSNEKAATPIEHSLPTSDNPPSSLWPDGNQLSSAGRSNRRNEEPQNTNSPVNVPTPPAPVNNANNEATEVKPKKRVTPSPYCDFCLGNATENKKTRQAERLVSCADCGRSGHPTCLQFTENMLKIVHTYRWQCIECKTCTICGTSENDDRLLFCDDCDRGYHLYCLSPPLQDPPEGEWFCHLCIKQFH